MDSLVEVRFKVIHTVITQVNVKTQDHTPRIFAIISPQDIVVLWSGCRDIEDYALGLTFALCFFFGSGLIFSKSATASRKLRGFRLSFWLVFAGVRRVFLADGDRFPLNAII